MADMTDEEKAKAILGDEVEPVRADEPSTEPAAPTEEEEQLEVEEPGEEEKPTEPEEPTDSTFTKRFPNLKGETPEEYLPELEEAYDNSFKEALRLKKENDELKARPTQAPTAIETPPATPATPPPAYAAIDEHPAIQYAKAKQTEDMLSAFDDFKKSYPQATDQADFERFTKASDGVNKALTDSLGRAPTYQELFPAIAGSLGWKPSNPGKDAAIKDNAASTRAPGSQSPTAPRKPKISDAQIDTYLKMFTSKTREEAIKELSEVV